MGTAIVLILLLLGVGMVVNQLLRLRNWLKKSPSSPEVQEPPDAKP